MTLPKIFIWLLLLTATSISIWYAQQLNQLNKLIKVAHANEQLTVSRIPTYKLLRPALLPVCSCESSYEGNSTSIPRQFDRDGSVRYGRANPSDVGMCQINSQYHEKDAVRMGMDIRTEEGNVAFANHLYDTQGLAPWSWSKSCWGNK